MNGIYYESAKLKELREKKKLTQEDVGKAVSVDRQTIYRAEAGIAVSYELLCELAQFHQVNVKDLLVFPPIALAQAA